MIVDTSLANADFTVNDHQRQMIIDSADNTPDSNSLITGIKAGLQHRKNNIDLKKFVQKLESNAKAQSSSRCARYVRIALEFAGAKIVNNPVAAADWGATLQKIGFKKIKPAFDNPKVGDIYIIHRTKKHIYGHIAGFTGSSWISDFRQNSYAIYRDPNVTYSYYRLGL